MGSRWKQVADAEIPWFVYVPAYYLGRLFLLYAVSLALAGGIPGWMVFRSPHFIVGSLVQGAIVYALAYTRLQGSHRLLVAFLATMASEIGHYLYDIERTQALVQMPMFWARFGLEGVFGALAAHLVAFGLVRIATITGMRKRA